MGADIKRAELIDELEEAIKSENLAIFAGAGLSIPAGYFDWKGLLKEPATQINLNIDKEENDLLNVAQYFCNSKGRTKIENVIIDSFSSFTNPTENHLLLASLEFNDYEKELKKAHVWYSYQQSLLDILYKISDLKYTLHVGYVSREQCISLLPIYSKQVVDTQARLISWHQANGKRLHIDIEEIRRKRVGVDKIIYFIPGLIKGDLNFRELDESTTNMIRDQIAGNSSEYRQSQSELYQKDVQLISKDGKIYYLPETKIEYELPVLNKKHH